MFDFRKWFRKTFRVDGRFTRNRPKHCPRQARLALEHLEDRLVPSTVDLTGTTTYLSQYPAGSQPAPQMLGVTSENPATGTFNGTWADGLNKQMMPVTGQVGQEYTLSNGVNLSYVSLSGRNSGEIIQYNGYIASSASGMEMLGQFADLHVTPADGNMAEDQLEVAGFNRNAPTPGSLTLGQQAMEWAVAQCGQFVPDPNVSNEQQSNASCTDLVDAALMKMGAEGLDQLNTPNVLMGGYGNYVWGNLAARFNPNTASPSSYNVIQPGEVLQFHDVGPRLQTPITSDGYTYNYTYQQHTDIVVDNRGNGLLDTMDQNVNNQKVASLQTIDLAQLTGGASDAEISVYQPVKA